MTRSLTILLILTLYMSCTNPVSTTVDPGGEVENPQEEPVVEPDISDQVTGTSYYIDYESGDDSNSGTSMAAPWKHAPGDSNAQGAPASTILEPGDAVIFKGGINYYGNLTMLHSGTAQEPVRYLGDRWGNQRAIINGSTPLNGWAQYPGNTNIYYTDLPQDYPELTGPAVVNPQEWDSVEEEYQFLWISQSPNPVDPYFADDHHGFTTIPQSNMTLTSLRDPAVFNQSDPDYWKGSWLRIWTNPNRVVLREIQSFDPAGNTVHFEALNDTALYPDGRDQSYAIYNSLHALDQPGEYYIDMTNRRIYLYPRSPSQIETSIVASQRNFGIDVAGASGLVIEGFRVINHSGEGLRDAIGIGSVTQNSVEKEYLFIRNNYITHNRHSSRGYGGISLENASHVIIEDNYVGENIQSRGIFCSRGSHITMRNNEVYRSGSTSLTFYTVTNSQIINNTVRESKGGHANGITLYIASYNILVAGNRVIDCASPITIQDSGNLYFYNNLVYSIEESCFNEWGRTTRGPWAYGEIHLVNNSFYSLNNTKGVLTLGKGREPMDVQGQTIPGNSYLQYNNIIHGGGVAPMNERNYNLYTALRWDQNSNYGWELADKEVLQENARLIYTNPGTGDMSLAVGSPAGGMGIDGSAYLPADLFPGYNFYRDIEGNPRLQNGAWSMGCYE